MKPISERKPRAITKCPMCRELVFECVKCEELIHEDEWRTTTTGGWMCKTCYKKQNRHCLNRHKRPRNIYY